MFVQEDFLSIRCKDHTTKGISANTFLEPLMLVDAIRELNEDIGIPEDLTTAIRQAKKGEEISDEEIERRLMPWQMTP